MTFEELAALVREYFGLERDVACATSNRQRKMRVKRMRQIYKQLCEAVDFDRGYHPNLPQILEAKKQQREAGEVAQ